MLQAHIPHNPFVAAFGVLIVGVLCGIDGSGFAGLPLTGALSGALAMGTSINPAMLAAVGQMGSVWTGGGTLVAWSSLVAVAGFAGVSAEDLVRKLFVPVVVAMIIATIFAVIVF
jgi:C4-dicarboxylate transporter